TELFKQRFRHCATRSFMILRNYKGREVSIGRQQLRSQRVLDWLHEIVDFPVVKETYNEILHEVMDLDHAREILGRIEAGEITVAESDFASLPSPFAHNVVLQGVSDLVLMEDRSALLRELHRKVLERVMPTDAISSIQFQSGEIAEYFLRKRPKIGRKEDILAYLDRVGDANHLRQEGRAEREPAEARTLLPRRPPRRRGDPLRRARADPGTFRGGARQDPHEATRHGWAVRRDGARRGTGPRRGAGRGGPEGPRVRGRGLVRPLPRRQGIPVDAHS